jgi:putative resolvase
VNLIEWAQAQGIHVTVVERRDRLRRANTELVEAALSAHDRRLVVLDDGEVDDDLVGEMVEVLTSFCARLYGRRLARNRALKALGCAQRGIGPKLVVAQAHDSPMGKAVAPHASGDW